MTDAGCPAGASLTVDKLLDRRQLLTHEELGMLTCAVDNAGRRVMIPVSERLPPSRWILTTAA